MYKAKLIFFWYCLVHSSSQHTFTILFWVPLPFLNPWVLFDSIYGRNSICKILNITLLAWKLIWCPYNYYIVWHFQYLGLECVTNVSSLWAMVFVFDIFWHILVKILIGSVSVNCSFGILSTPANFFLSYILIAVF